MTKRSFPDKLGVFLPCENGGEDHTDLLENQIMGGKKPETVPSLIFIANKRE